MAPELHKETTRSARILGSEGVAALASSCVMVLGLGGVGSSCVEALARGGVGRFILVDHDVVDITNINRQAIAFHSTIGRKKIDVMRQMVLDINPQAQVEVVDSFVLAENLDALLDEHAVKADFVVDAIDTISTKLAIAAAAQERDINLISAMGGGNKLHPEYLRVADIYDTVNCRMCRIMRKECRKRGISHLRVLYSCEEAAAATARPGTERGERSGLGTMPYFPPIMGQMIAGYVIRSIAGVESREDVLARRK